MVERIYDIYLRVLTREDKVRISKRPCNFFLFYKIFTIHNDVCDFPKVSDHFPKIFEDIPKFVQSPGERFHTFSDDFRTFFEDYPI